MKLTFTIAANSYERRKNMNRYRLFIIPCLALATALSWGAGQSRAESQDASQSPPVNGTANTGSFRNPESVPKLRSTTNAQRKEAARRAAQYRAEVARAAALKKKKTTGTAPTDSTVPPIEKGGTNE
jgi:hypothetical protein